jgi:hypothetical protein
MVSMPLGAIPPYHPAQFVHVGIDHDARAMRALGADDRAHAVVAERGGQRLHHVHQHLAHRLFEARRTGRVGQFLQGVDGAVLRIRGRGAQQQCAARKKARIGGCAL